MQLEMLGWRLGTLADKLQENNLAAVRILPKRYSELERNQPYVAFIGITPIDEKTPSQRGANSAQ
jgi:hypothetical protein